MTSAEPSELLTSSVVNVECSPVFTGISVTEEAGRVLSIIVFSDDTTEVTAGAVSSAKAVIAGAAPDIKHITAADVKYLVILFIFIIPFIVWYWCS